MSKDNTEKNKKQENYIATEINTNSQLHFVADETDVIQQLERITQQGEWEIELEKEKVGSNVAKNNKRSSKNRSGRCSIKKRQ